VYTLRLSLSNSVNAGHPVTKENIMTTRKKGDNAIILRKNLNQFSVTIMMGCWMPEKPTASSSDKDIYREPEKLLQNLIRFNTTNPPGNEAKCINYINTLLTQAGFRTVVLFKDKNRPNLIVRLQGRGAPPILLYGHVDVVTTANQKWTHPPFEAEVEDGFIWGRGALDMKGGVAMMLSAFLRSKAEHLSPSGDVVLAVLSDEEGGSDYGAKFLVENHPDLFKGIKYAIGELGGFSSMAGKKRFYPIMVAEKRICHLKAVIHGPGGHASQRIRGTAMTKLGELLRQLDSEHMPVHITPVVKEMIEEIASALGFPLGLFYRQLLKPPLTDLVLRLIGKSGRSIDPLVRNTVNATIVHGGEKFNVVPSEISLELDARILPGVTTEEFIAELRKIIGEDVELEIIRTDTVPVEPDMGFFRMLSEVLREGDPGGISVPMLLSATTDARFFSRIGIQTYGFTPMKLPPNFNFIERIHAEDERIPVESLAFGADMIYKILQRF
jgi:acetylornithine deacetylase/succinyl-diaminopimelate desuccinylase-like protein